MNHGGNKDVKTRNKIASPKDDESTSQSSTKKRKTRICRNSCKNRCFTSSDEARSKGLCKQCYYRYLIKNDRGHEILEKTSDTDSKLNRHRGLKTKKYNPIPESSVKRLINSNNITNIEKKLINNHSTLDVLKFINQFRCIEMLNYDIDSGKIYKKIFNTALWKHIKIECEKNKNLYTGLVTNIGIGFLLSVFLMRLELVILERKISSMIEISKKLKIERDCFGLMKLSIDYDRFIILPNKVKKIASKFMNNVEYIKSSEFGINLKYRFRGMFKEGKTFGNNDTLISSGDNEFFFAAIARRICCFDTVIKQTYDIDNTHYLPLTEIASFNSSKYQLFIKEVIKQGAVRYDLIEYLSLLFLVLSATTKSEFEYIYLNDSIEYEFTTLTQKNVSIKPDEFVSKFIKNLERKIPNQLKEKLPKLFADIIDHKKIRNAMSQKKAVPSKNIRKYLQQIEQLRAVFRPYFDVYNNKIGLLRPLNDFGTIKFEKTEYKFDIKESTDSDLIGLNLNVYTIHRKDK